MQKTWFNNFHQNWKLLINPRLEAFTLVELVVVMGIIALLGALGIAGMTLLRQNIQFQQVESDVITSLTSVRNQARNSVASRDLASGGTTLPNAVVDAYAFGVIDNNYSTYRCSISNVGINPQANCSQPERENIKPQTLQEVNVFMLDPAKCRALIFERLTSDVRAMANLIDAPDNTGICTIRVQHSGNASLRRDIVIDLVKNTIDVV